ncbi:MAG: transglycosylase SLT domain-containing protein [Deltaproteobacteria bacterium]|nr:transglycosylase SLT domain-containing protein [Deltaproteobacteria bacterium]
MVRIGLLTLILILVAQPHTPQAQELDARAAFTQAHALYASGDYPQAKELFQKTTDPKYPLADYSLYYLGVISANEKNWDLSRHYLTQLKRRYPQSIWFHGAELQRAKIDLAEKKYAQAIAAFHSLRSARGGRQEIFQESLHLEAQAREASGEIGPAYALYQQLRVSYPHSRWTATARKEQARLREKFPELFAVPTPQSLAEEADRLAREQAYSEAATICKKLLSDATDPEFRLRLLVKLAGLYLDQRRREEAIPLLDQIARDYPETAEAPKATYQIGQILWNRHDNAQAIEYFKRVTERYPASAYVDRALYASADIYEYFGNKEKAVQLYGDLPKRFPRSQVRDDATWRLAWLYYRSGELPSAFSAFGDLAVRDGGNSLRTPALYWQARTAEKSGDLESAKKLLRQIAGDGEESYYQALALRALERLGAPIEEPKAGKVSSGTEADPPLNPEFSFHLARARELTVMSLNRLAAAELDEANLRSRKQARLRPLLMREYFRAQAYGRSLMVANQIPASNGERNLYRFPLAYWDTIQQKAQERDLDPFLILALIRQESLFDAQARSPAFALGLMQLLPSTAARVAKLVGLEPPSNEKLFEPEVNLTLGTQYLKDLLLRYSNNWFKAIAAYNAGEAAVDRWEKEIVTDDIEEFVERIPYVETRGYVKLVMRNHRIYKKLYETQK